MFNYQKICSKLFKDLPQRTKQIIEGRFGFDTGEKKTLDAVGKNFGICRERVRQIEKIGFSLLEKKKDQKEYQEVFKYFVNHLNQFGGLKREDILLEELGGKKSKPQVSFLLSFGNQFKRFTEDENFYPLWAVNQKSLTSAKKVLNGFVKKLSKKNQLFDFEELLKFSNINSNVLTSYLEVSKKIAKGPFAKFGLSHSPEINPRGIKDKAYLVFKEEQRPLHFTETASFIGKLVSQKANTQTVHNELIKDSRFVLIGRGVYALDEWGYEHGCVKDIISNVLKRAKMPLGKEKILKQVLAQRQVKRNTILLNLNNKNYFLRNDQGKYKTKEA